MVIVRTLIFTIFVPGSVAAGAPYLLLSSDVELLSYGIGNFRFTGVLPMALGALSYLWCAWNFAFVGKGTPAPIDPPKVLVSRGLYRVVRNPMYVGVGLILVGEAIVFESLTLLAYALFVWSMFHLFIVYYEEPTLRRKFGAAYEEYCKAVPRWMPRRRP
jgi:protein-S-isoprenylcysteine O-methyltransferase Ste14